MSSTRFPQPRLSFSPTSLDPITIPSPTIPVEKEEKGESTDTTTTASNSTKPDSESATTSITSEDAESMLVELGSHDGALNVTGDDSDVQPSPEPSLDQTPPAWKLRPTTATKTTATTTTSFSGPKIVRGFTIPPPAQSPPPHRTIFNPHPDFVPWLTSTTAAIAAGAPNSPPPSPPPSGPQITRGFKVPPESRALTVFQFLTRPEPVVEFNVAQPAVSQAAPTLDQSTPAPGAPTRSNEPRRTQAPLNQSTQPPAAPTRGTESRIAHPQPTHTDLAAHRRSGGESPRESQDRATGTPPIPIPGRNSNSNFNATHRQEPRQRTYPQRTIHSPAPQPNSHLDGNEPHLNRDSSTRRIDRGRPESEGNFYRCETRSLLGSEEGQRELDQNLTLVKLEHTREWGWGRLWRSVTARVDEWGGRVGERVSGWVRRRDDPETAAPSRTAAIMRALTRSTTPPQSASPPSSRSLYFARFPREPYRRVVYHGPPQLPPDAGRRDMCPDQFEGWFVPRMPQRLGDTVRALYETHSVMRRNWRRGVMDMEVEVKRRRGRGMEGERRRRR
ncbi:hypothetical protein EX30DRAFT_398426 [Ascodesmis nigricans]|uniref:Uncharacterized protein n=1 Tax=Ascodesmis nigricans TaxID=341454 RepID=A0A4S2MKQ3_9PEZI|nr:hypothetical protein EX30DRAFT_398426 [Ascodesmis nigricans]